MGKPRNDSIYESVPVFGKIGADKGKLVGYAAVPTVIQNKYLNDMMQTFNIDTIHNTGLSVAANSLREVMADVIKTYPDLKGRIRTDGMCVPRFISTHKSKKNPIPKKPSKLSNHSWGCAIDLRVDGIKDEQADNLVLQGLELIAPIFNKYGWVWGGAYITALEDGMHFEVSKEALLAWDKAGLLRKKGVFPVGVLAIQKQKPSHAPLAQRSFPQNNYFRAPLPRRPGESWPNWFGRTTKSWARKAGTWFR